MKRLFPIFTLAAIISFVIMTGCKKKNNFFASPAKKIQGTWVYSKVRYQQANSFKCKDLTADYSNYTVEFTPSYNVVQTYTPTGSTQTGNWTISTYQNNYYNSSDNYSPQYCQELIGTIQDSAAGGTRILNWKSLVVMSNKITCRETRNGGRYSYTLKRIN